MTDVKRRSANLSGRGLIALASLSIGLSVATMNYVPAAKASSLLDSYRWQNRPLIVIAPGASDPLVQAQRDALISESRALQERDMVRIEVLGDDVKIDGTVRTDVSASEIRARYRIASHETRALLVGKDGGVKVGQTKAISARQLFDTIDAMPMRRRETGSER